MKQLKDYIEESLIKSYDHDKLIKILMKKFPFMNPVIWKSKSENPSSFYLDIDVSEYDNTIEDQKLWAIINLYGYWITEQFKEDNIIKLRFEPIFGKKCTNYIYKECRGVIYHITHKDNAKSISKHGIIPMSQQNYRYFEDRTFFISGETPDEILKGCKFIMKQLRLDDNYIIYRIDLNKHHYNIDLYYDPSEDSEFTENKMQRYNVFSVVYEASSK